MRRRTGLSYLFKMVSRTNIELNIVLIAIVLVFNIDFVCPSDVNKNLSTTPIPPNIHYTTELVNRNFSVQNSNDEIDDDTLSFSTDNELWDGLIKDCLRNPTFACFQKNVHSYLNSALDLDDVNVTSGFKFLKNKVDLYKYTKEANDHFTKENEIPDEEARSATPIEEVTDALSGKGVQFLMTHDIELNMPGMLFDSSILRISPRSFEGNGALVKVELIPNEARSIKATGRIFKKIKKFFRNKLLLSFLAIVLVIKLIKIKVLWILPLIFGVATAKKLILKFVLFLFPAFAHIFTLCSYYQKNYQDTKFHHHQHHISHLHTVVPPWYNEPHHDHHHDHHHGHGPELIYTSPPKGHPSEYLHGPSINTNYGHDWEPSGPGLGSEYISDVHRIAQVHNFKPKVDDVNEINSWGLGTTMPSSASHSNNNNPLLKDTPIRTYKSDQIGQYNSPVYTPVKVAPKNAPVQYNTIQNDKMAHEAQRLQAQQKEAMRILAEQKLVAQQQKILQQQPFVQDTTSSVSAYVDPFYSPILAKIDKIFLQLNIIDEPCRERLVCNMYKNPAKYSPHSNFISAELSRDTSELRRPDSTNPAVIRFYRYVQAARDGQDQKDCQEFFKLCQIRME